MDGLMYNAIADNDVTRLKRLIRQGGDVDLYYIDLQGISTKSLLHIGCEKGRIDCVRVLLDAGADISPRDAWRQTPLMYCMQTHYHEVAEVLLERNPSQVNIPDTFGKMAIHCAAESGCEESVNLLIKYGADLNAQTSEGNTPLMCLCLTRQVENAAKVSQILINAGTNLEMFDYHGGRTALQKAVLTKNTELVESLIQLGADVNTVDVMKRTPLTNFMLEYVRGGHCQPDSGTMTIIALLTQSGADMNIAVGEHSNPLIVSAFLTADSLVKYFIDNGANPNVHFASGISPLLVATSRKSIDVVKTLLYHNALVNKRGKIVRNKKELYLDAFELALECGLSDFIRLYVEIGYNSSTCEYLRGGPDCAAVPEQLQTDPYLISWLYSKASSPNSLLLSCVLKIRSILDQKLEVKVNSLSLPERIKSVILMKDVLLNCQE